MTPEEKVLKHYMEGITLLTFEERKEILNKVLKTKLLRKLSEEMANYADALIAVYAGKSIQRRSKQDLKSMLEE